MSQSEQVIKDTDQSLVSRLWTPQREAVRISVERNTIRLEDEASEHDPHIREKVAQEIEYSQAFLKSGIPISITCYVGGGKCTKQFEMIKGLLERDSSYSDLITPHLTCNFSNEETRSYIRELHDMGIRHFLALSGDKLRYKQFKREPGLRESVDLVKLIRTVENEMRVHGELAEPSEISVAYSPFKGNGSEGTKLERKLSAGATSVKTQPVTYADTASIEQSASLFGEKGVLVSNSEFSVIYFQIIHFKDAKGNTIPMQDHFIKHYGIQVPDDIVARLTEAYGQGTDEKSAKSEVFKEGLAIAAESVAYLVQSGARSINIMGVKQPKTYNKLMTMAQEMIDQGVSSYSPERSIQKGEEHRYGLTVG